VNGCTVFCVSYVSQILFWWS